jgi:hypothetical protein
VHHILTNPVYAGAYVFGRTGSRVTIENGRKRNVRGFRKEQSEWEVLLIDHHEGYHASCAPCYVRSWCAWKTSISR